MAEMTEQEAAAQLETLEGSAKKKLLIFGAMVLATVGVAAGGGYMVSRAVHGGGGGGGEGGEAKKHEAAESKPAAGAVDESSAYINLEPIIVNANEPKLQRYIRAVICLVVSKEKHGEVNELINKHKDEVRNVLVTYLAGCSLEEVRGTKNLHRVRREIADLLNEQFWPNQKPRVNSVLFKDFNIQ